MKHKYSCVSCEYYSNRKSSFTDHINSKKHKINIELYKHYINEDNINSIQEDYIDTQCKYCSKILSNCKSLKRHMKSCKAKQIFEQKQQLENKLELKKKKEIRLITKLEVQKEKLNELEEVNNDYMDLLKQIAKSKTSPNTINIHYIINHFTEALNYEDLMKLPLTEEESKKLAELEPLSGTIYMIESRCIDGIDIKKRPLHCLDTSRNKYIVRTDNEWVIDHNARKIFKEASKHMYEYYVTDPSNEEVSLDTVMKNQQKLLKMETKGSQNKMIKDLNDKVYIKNIKLDDN